MTANIIENATEPIEDFKVDQLACTDCKRTFKTTRGLSQHLRSCLTKKTYSDSAKIAEPEPPDMEIVDSNTIKNNQLVYKWGSYDNKTFEINVDFIYEKVVYWRKN